MTELSRNDHWQFSLRWLLGITTLVAAGAALYSSFPREMELAMMIAFFVSALVLPGTPQIVEGRPWIGLVFCFLLGPWVLFVAVTRLPEYLSSVVLLGFLMYLFATFFILLWMRRSDRGDY